MRHTLYYTQRNQGKFILVETKAPAGYFGDWTDIDHPGTAGTPLGKRAYYVEITQDNNNSVLWLDNADYNADILTADKGGTKLVTSGGVETTVSIYSTAKDSTRVYRTDNSGKAANEDGYTTTATDGVMKNDRTLGGRCDRCCGLFQNRGCRRQPPLAHDHPRQRRAVGQ